MSIEDILKEAEERARYQNLIEEILNMDFDKKSNWYISGFTVEREEKERLVKELTALLKEVREDAIQAMEEALRAEELFSEEEIKTRIQNWKEGK